MVRSCRPGRQPTNGYRIRVRAGVAGAAIRETRLEGIKGVPIGVAPKPASLAIGLTGSPE